MAKVEVVMPEMGESVMEGTVIEWAKKIGDKIEVDDILLEIATDKVDTEVPSPESGILVEILVGEGDTVEVGKPLAVIETDPEAARDLSSDGAGSKQSAEAEETGPQGAEDGEKRDAGETEQAQAEETSDSEKTEPDTHTADTGKGDDDGERIEVVMPQMGESVIEGTVIEWAKNVGDTVDVDEALLEVATDKVDTEIPSPATGTLVEILAGAGETIEVGQTIAVIQTGAASAREISADRKTQPEEEKVEKGEASAASAASNGTQTAETVAAGKEGPQRVGSDGRFYSPLVRSIAREEGISQEELESIEGSGKEGRVSKDDILAYIEKRKAGEVVLPPKSASGEPAQPPPGSPSHSRDTISAGELNVQRPTGNVEIIKMDRMRKMIADHMVRSKQTSAHVTTFTEVDLVHMVRWRESNKRSFQQKTGVKLTYTPIFIESIIQAIQEFPLINSSVDGDEIIVKKDINFGIAVALGEGGKGGLIVPVIKQAQDKNLVGLAKMVSEVAEKARNKDLKPDDLVGGTITLTNYGSVGNLMGTPIINQPQVAILGTGVIQKRPVVVETGEGDSIAIRPMMYLSMSYDHRIIDGAHGGAFLNRIKKLMENFDVDRPV